MLPRWDSIKSFVKGEKIRKQCILKGKEKSKTGTE